MTKEKKESNEVVAGAPTKNLTAEKAEVEAKKEEEAIEKTAKEVQEVLESNKYALQPFLMVSEQGIVPSVRLAKMPGQAGAPKK